MKRVVAKGCEFVILVLSVTLAAVSPALAQHSPQFESGCHQMQTKRFQDAISSFTEAIAITPGDSLAMFRRGQAFYCLGKYDDALADFARAIKLDPDVPSFYVWRGTAQSKAGHDAWAIRDFQKAMRLEPSLISNYKAQPSKNAGETGLEVTPALSGSSKKKEGTIDLGRNDKALEDYAEAVRRASLNVTAYFRSGTVFSGICQMGADGKALSSKFDEQKDGTISKRDGDDYFELRDDESDKALRNLDNEIDAHQEDAKLYYCRARLRQHMGWLEMALNDYDRAVELDKGNAAYLLARAFLYHQQQKEGLASADLEAAINLDPDLPETILFTAPGRWATRPVGEEASK